MKKTIKIITCILFTLTCWNIAFAEEQTVLSASVSLNDRVPIELFGTWRVVSNLSKTDSPANFKKMGVDLWNLYRTGNVINLSNPMTGASASVNVEYIKNTTIRFTKEGVYDNQKLTDTVEITLNGTTFTGTNYLSLKTYSDSDKTLIIEKKASYNLKGDKISGMSILER